MMIYRQQEQPQQHRQDKAAIKRSPNDLSRYMTVYYWDVEAGFRGALERAGERGSVGGMGGHPSHGIAVDVPDIPWQPFPPLCLLYEPVPLFVAFIPSPHSP